MSVEELPAESLSLVSQLANELAAVQSQINNLNALLEEATEKLVGIEQRRLPEAMADLGLVQLTLDTGEQITVRQEFHASIPKARRTEAMRWLRDNELGDLIKNELTVTFGKGEDAIADVTYQRMLTEFPDHAIETAQVVHPSTLKSLVKTQFESGAPLPEELFGVFIINRAIIKRG